MLSMLWRFISVLTVTLFWTLPPQLEAFVVAQSTGCHHNGTWYADKSLVPTVEKCLNCQCNKKTLVCRLKVCPEVPMPPPRGCVVVQQKNTCCPYLSCARLNSFYNIPTANRIIAYLDQYERESIDRVVNDNMLQRRSDDSEVDLYVCVKNGTVYKSGSAMSSSNLCTFCYCIGGSEKCVKPKCMLPVEGCKPIFIDSTCCPVRYDCSTKTSGKSSQEVRYRKNSNKHFMRMSQRLQRNRGCTVGKQFYAEGQKMKSDADKPCDICFCIRGTRRCAPKKCSPALKNCMPVVPKGQCCPSSYDCGSQRDYRRAQSSRQFNLLSFLFGKKEANGNATMIPVQYPHDRHPSVTAVSENPVSASSEKNIFDTIREGLEFIDSNNEQMLEDNVDMVELDPEPAALKMETSTPSPNKVSSTTEVSFLDLLLGSSDTLISNEAENIVEKLPELKTTTGNDGLSWVDLLLGPDDDEIKNVVATTISDKLDAETTTHFLNEYGTTNIDRLGDNFDDFSGSGEISVGDYTTAEQNDALSTKSEEDVITDTLDTTGNVAASTETVPTVETTQTFPTTLSEATEEVKSTTRAITESSTVKPKVTTTAPLKAVQTEITVTSAPVKTIMKNTKTTVETLHKTDSLPLKDTIPSIKNETSATKPTKNNNLFTALLDGITDMLSVDRNSNKTVQTNDKAPGITSKPTRPRIKPTPQVSSTTTRIKPSAKPTTKPLPLFRPLPIVKPYTRINSKISNFTTNPATLIQNVASNPTVKPNMKLFTTTVAPKSTTEATTPNGSSTTAKPTATPTITKPKKNVVITTTANPVIIKTNPTILEAEPLDSNAEPTLPPSLPNLKIIPFLPTDAVKADRNKPSYDYYQNNPQISRIDYDIYSYPAITERFPTYPDLEDGSTAEYIYKFKVEGPDAAIAATTSKLDGTAAGSAAYFKYDFMSGGGLQPQGFSPPTRTEGGFMPKEPIPIDDSNDAAGSDNFKLEDNYHVTQHIIDITTADPMLENTTKIIDITTPDPFKDVIRTEPPPDLTSLIEDKQKNELANKNTSINITGLSQSSIIAKPNKTLPDVVIKEEKNTIESLLDALFRDDFDDADLVVNENSKTSTTTTTTTTTTNIPPFKTLPKDASNLLLTELSSTKATLPTTPTITTTTTARPIRTKNRTTNVTTANRIKSRPKPTLRHNTTLATKNKKPKPTRAAPTKSTTTVLPPSTTETTVVRLSSTMNPFLMSPFNKLPFMDASFEVKPPNSSSSSTSSPAATKANSSNLLGLVEYKNSLNKFEGLEPAYESFHSTSLPSKTNLEQQFEQAAASASIPIAAASSSLTSASAMTMASSTTTTTTTSTTTATNAINTQHASSNSLIDPNGILKLAGCNIYGRMYRVGRIILELSSPCLECKCTDVGVKCGPLDC